MGPFDGYQVNRAPMIGVIAKHRAAVGNIENPDSVPADLLGHCRKAWDDALDLGEIHGFRNAQATVLAPTGTISFMMDCDTTGVEPDFSLVKSKKLVGGGEITIVNKTVPMALEKLGYAPREVEEIVAFVDERNTVVGAPYVKTEHYPGVRLRRRRARDPLPRPREDDGRRPAVHLRRDLEDGEPARGGDGRGRDGPLRRRVEARREGDRDLPRQLQGRAAAVELRQGRPDRRRDAAGARARAQAAAARPHRGRPQVPGRRPRGLHPRRPLRRRQPGRHLRRHREGRHDDGRPDELALPRRLDGPPVRRAARGVRLEALATCASSRAA